MMKVSKLLGEHFKEAPADCQIASHALMVRGGYIKQVGTGIFSLYPSTKRITRKIENILREEMDRIGGQEVLFPVAMPASIWRESGRYDSIGSELLRFRDRNGADMVLGMTHEEAAVHLARVAAQTYTKFPYMIYQIQTKFRDEPRARGGLIRVREFTMKDAYSFHTSWDDLLRYYDECYEAYNRIFRRCGVKNFVAVKSDSGMMGGSVSHEFMLISDIGEDTLVICSECDYMEAADCIVHNHECEIEPLEEVSTPHQKTIEEVCNYLHVPKERSCKAVLYQRNADDSLVIVFVRGDLEINETKLRNYLRADVHPATVTEAMNIHAGFIGPIGLPEDVTVVYDESLKGINSLVAGANKDDTHFRGLNIARDVGEVEYVSVAKATEGGICPVCGKHSITIKKGIEIGNIFQLGTKYTKSMGMEYIDKNGETQNPIMGCYGIGVGRLAASICEESHDDYGPIWPMPIAPWQVHICAVRSDDADVKACADKLYDTLQNAGAEVIYDDRQVSAGVMFSDADLLGIPLRVVVSPRNLKDNCCEISARDKSFSYKVPVEETADKVQELIKELMAKFND